MEFISDRDMELIRLQNTRRNLKAMIGRVPPTIELLVKARLDAVEAMIREF